LVNAQQLETFAINQLLILGSKNKEINKIGKFSYIKTYIRTASKLVQKNNHPNMGGYTNIGGA
jgi:hypothetical protein